MIYIEKSAFEFFERWFQTDFKVIKVFRMSLVAPDISTPGLSAGSCLKKLKWPWIGTSHTNFLDLWSFKFFEHLMDSVFGLLSSHNFYSNDFQLHMAFLCNFLETILGIQFLRMIGLKGFIASEIWLVWFKQHKGRIWNLLFRLVRPICLGLLLWN